MTLRPLGDRVVLKQLEVEETTKSGIVLPGQNKEKPEQAEVVAVGPGAVENGKEIKMYVKVGDKVVYSKYSGNTVKLDEEEYVIVRQSDVLAVIEEGAAKKAVKAPAKTAAKKAAEEPAAEKKTATRKTAGRKPAGRKATAKADEKPAAKTAAKKPATKKPAVKAASKTAAKSVKTTAAKASTKVPGRKPNAGRKPAGRKAGK